MYCIFLSEYSICDYSIYYSEMQQFSYVVYIYQFRKDKNSLVSKFCSLCVRMLSHLPTTHSKEGSPFGHRIIDFIIVSINNLKKHHQPTLTQEKLQPEETWKIYWSNLILFDINVTYMGTLTSVKFPFPLGSTKICFTVSMRSACPFTY